MREQFPFYRLKSVVYSVGAMYGDCCRPPCPICTSRRALGKIVPFGQQKRQDSWLIGSPRNHISSPTALATRPVN